MLDFLFCITYNGSMTEIKPGYHECLKPDGAGGVYVRKPYDEVELHKTTLRVLRLCNVRTASGCRENCPVNKIKEKLSKEENS